MNTKRIILALAVMVAIGSAVTGCHTAKGAGQDIEKAGEKIQKAAD